MIPDGEDEYDLPVGQMEAMTDGADAFANVGQGLVGDHKTAMLQYWQQIIDDIERISDDGTDTDVFKSTVLPLARIKKVMKTDSEVRMISAEAPILFAKGCDIFITELTMRAWIHAEENKRRTLQRSDIATAIQKSDVFDFLIDIVPREEAQPRRPAHRMSDQHSASHHDQSASMGGAMPPMSGGALVGNGLPPGSRPPIPGQPDISGFPASLPPTGIPNLGTLGSLAQLGNLNGMDLSGMNLGNINMSYENMQIPSSLGGYPPGSDLRFAQQGGNATGVQPQSQLMAQSQMPRQEPHLTQMSQSTERQQQQSQLGESRPRQSNDPRGVLPPLDQTPYSQPQMQRSQPAPQQNQQQQNQQSQNISDSRTSPKQESKTASSVQSAQESPYSSKEEESFTTNTRYDSGELPFTSYSAESVDVPSYGQNY